MVVEQQQRMREQMADIRALSTSLAVPGNMAQNFEIGMRAYSRSPQHSILMTAQFAAEWLVRAEDLQREQGVEPSPFPREALARATARLKPRPGRADAATGALDLLETVVASPVPDIGPVDDLIKTHGFVGFMALVNLYNKCGQILVDADPGLDDLSDLFERQALADEIEWQDLLDSDG